MVCRGVFADFLPELAEITIYPTGLPQWKSWALKLSWPLEGKEK